MEPTREPVVLLVNPAAGRGRAVVSARVVAERLRERGHEVEVVAGTNRADADARLATTLARCPLAAIAVGGDGTVHQLLQRAVGTDIAFGVVAAGTGNDSATALGLPREAAATADLVAELLASSRRLRSVDTGEVLAADGTRRAFLAVLSSGFDSAVNERAKQLRWPGGRARYLRAIVAELRVFRAVPYRVLLDAGLPSELSYERAGMLVAVGNGPSYGGGMRVCPDALLDDGRLSLTMLAEMRTATFLRVFPTVFRGTHVRRPEVHTHVAQTVRLDAPGQAAYADGERIGPLPVTVRVRPASLRVLAPAVGSARVTGPARIG